MMRKILLLLLMYGQIVLPSKAAQASKLDKIYNDVVFVESGVRIVKFALRVGSSLLLYINPDAQQIYDEAYIQQQIRIAKTEEQLKQCLVTNAFAQRENGQFPTECKGLTELFAKIAGFEERNALKWEFNKAVEGLPRPPITKIETVKEEQGTSTTKKVLIGGAVVIIVGGTVFFLSPLILPGTVIATKAAAATAAIKSGIVATGAQVSAAKVFVTTKVTESNAVFAAMPLATKVTTTATIIKSAELACNVSQLGYSCVVTSNEEELQQLKHYRKFGKSLRDRILEMHFSQSSHKA